jgi:hypothetical protein
VRVGDRVEYLCASEGWISRRYAWLFLNVPLYF